MKNLPLVLGVVAAMLVTTAGCTGPDQPTEPSSTTPTYGTGNGPLVSQDFIDYTENPVDVPNPDRGLYRANDGMVVPVSGNPQDGFVVDSQTTFGGSIPVHTMISHVGFDLRNFSSNAIIAPGKEYTAKYEAPKSVSIKSRGDKPPWDYKTNFEYWKKNVLPKWPRGTSQPLTDDALAFIRDKFQQVRDANGVVIPRFNYDGEGWSWVSVDHPEDGSIDELVTSVEPDKDLVLEHIAQVKPILQEYEDVIMSVDGGWFGPWGEEHSTKFGTSPEAYAWMLDAWLDAVPASRPISVEGGAFLSWYNNRYGTHYTFANIDTIPAPQPGTPEARFGFFNDSYAFGTDDPDWPADDWGSLSEGSGWPGSPLGTDSDYNRAKIMTWIRNQNTNYGGEAQDDGVPTFWNSFPFVAWEASYAQTTYLNLDYDVEVHQRWVNFTYNEKNVSVPMKSPYKDGWPPKGTVAIFDPVYDGLTGAEYWRDRLGYRLVLREANVSQWVERDGTLQFQGKVQNVGFGNVVNKKNVTVILKPKGGFDADVYTYLTDIDARDWRPDMDSRASNTAAYRDLSFSVDMSAFGSVPAGDYDIYLKINDPKETSANKRCVEFANRGDMWDADLGANLIGSTMVYDTYPADTSTEG